MFKVQLNDFAKSFGRMENLPTLTFAAAALFSWQSFANCCLKKARLWIFRWSSSWQIYCSLLTQVDFWRSALRSYRFIHNTQLWFYSLLTLTIKKMNFRLLQIFFPLQEQNIHKCKSYKNKMVRIWNAEHHKFVTHYLVTRPVCAAHTGSTNIVCWKAIKMNVINLEMAIKGPF